MEKKERVSLITKLLYGSGDLGFSMNNTLITAFYSLFLIRVMSIPVGLVSIIMLVGRGWDFVNDLLVGYISDRTRTKWGRRRPFILFGAIPFGLSFIFLWRSPEMSRTALIVYYTLAYIVYEAVATFVYMPYFALTPELSSDYDERTKITTFRMLFNFLGTLTGYLLVLLIFNFGDWYGVIAKDVLIMAAVAGGIAAIPLFGVFFGTRERKEFQADITPKFWPSLKAAFKNRPFVFGSMIYLFTWMTIVVVESNLQFFIIDILERPNQSLIIMLSILGTALIALPLWERVSKNWNKRLAYIIGMGFWATVMMVLIFMTPSTPLWLILALCIMAGVGLSAAQILPWAIIPDAIEWEEWHTGERNEGMFYSLVTLLGKFGMMVAQFLSLQVLSLTGYQEGQNLEGLEKIVQPPTALLGIRAVMGILPALLLITGIIFAFRYPLSRHQHNKLVEDLRNRRAARRAERVEKKPMPGVSEPV